ncbi:MAG: glycoside hydrolase family 5 protein [Oligosphaeraceae bacterium]|mgnify:CR=1 FL=1|nr:glycoside hydrolase family 5 protein [Oligosphaeraceae bacterium]
MKKNLWSILVIIAALPLAAAATTTRRGFMVSELTPEIINAVKNDWNCNIVRLQLIPFFWAQQKGIPHCEAWSWMMQELPAGLDRARDADIVVVIDLHNLPRPFPNFTDGREQLDYFWKDKRNLDLFIKCWQEIATICKDRPEEIWFDLMNEPLNWVDMPSYPKAWPQWAQAAIDSIRQIDTRHHIVIEPGPGGLCWGFKGFPLLEDPVNKLIYSAHQYQPHKYTMQGIRDITGTDLSQAYLERGLHWPGIFDDSEGGWWDAKRLEEKEMAPVIEFQKKNNVRIFIGEFSVARWAPDGAKYLEDCIALFEKYGWDWTYHAFRESRIWSLEHENTYTSEPAKAKTLTDRAQVVKRFLDKNQK